jgi:hypothetical protein
MDMQFEYGVGYDGQQSITVGYSVAGPLGNRISSTFVSTDVDVVAKAIELIELICAKHTLTRKAPPA